MVEHYGNKGLYAGCAAGAGWIGLGLFFQCMRCVVGTENIDQAVAHGFPQGILMALFADRGILLRVGAKAFITFRRCQCQVIG